MQLGDVNRMYDPDFCLENFFCHTWESLTGVMYVDIICGLVLLLQAAILYVPQRKQGDRWFTGVPLALAVAAFALAYHMWDIYRRATAIPHFPPGWFDSTSSSWESPELLLTTLLLLALTLLLLPTATAASFLLRDTVRFVVKRWH